MNTIWTQPTQTEMKQDFVGGIVACLPLSSVARGAHY